MQLPSQLSLEQLRIVSQPKSIRCNGYVSVALKFFDSEMHEFKIYNASYVHRDDAVVNNGLFFELCLGPHHPSSNKNNKLENEVTPQNHKRLQIVVSVQLVSAKYLPKEKNHVSISIPSIRKRKSNDSGKKEEHSTKLIDIHNNTCKLCIRGSGRCRYAERFKPISYNNQNEVVFYLKVLHDCATFNLSHFNLLFRALEKTYISEFQSSSLLIRGTGESSTLATGGSNPISSTTKILGILSDPFFVGESNHFHFPGMIRHEMSGSTLLSLNSLLFSKSVDITLSDSDSKYFEMENPFLEENSPFIIPLSHHRVDYFRIVMFLSVLLNSLIPVKLQQKFWSFLDKHLTHKKDSTSPSLAMSKSSDKVSSTTKFSTFDILLCIFEGHAESSEEIQQLVITILDTLELFKHSPESDHFENFHSYLDKNAITFQNAEGDTLLHYAATLGYYKLCEWLVLKGKADVNVQNIEGNTPLHLAINNRFRKIVTFLLENKAKTDIINLAGETPKELISRRLLTSLRTESDLHHENITTPSVSSHNTENTSSLTFQSSSQAPGTNNNNSNNSSNNNVTNTNPNSTNLLVSGSNVTIAPLSLTTSSSQRISSQSSSPRKSNVIHSPHTSSTTSSIVSGSQMAKSTNVEKEKETHNVTIQSLNSSGNLQSTTSQIVSQTSTVSSTKQNTSNSPLIHSSSLKLPKESIKSSEKSKEKAEKDKTKEKTKIEKEKEVKDKSKEKTPSVSTTNILKLFPKIGDWLKKKKKQIGTPFVHNKSPKPSEDVSLSKEWQEILETAGLSKQEIESNLETFQQLVPPHEYLPSSASSTPDPNAPQSVSSTQNTLDQQSAPSFPMDLNEFTDLLPVEETSVTKNSWEAMFSNSWNNTKEEESLSESFETSHSQNSTSPLDMRSFSPPKTSVLSNVSDTFVVSHNNTESSKDVDTSNSKTTNNSNKSAQKSNNSSNGNNFHRNHQKNDKNKKTKSEDLSSGTMNQNTQKETIQTSEDINDPKYQNYPEEVNLSFSDLGVQTSNPIQNFSNLRFLYEGETNEVFVALNSKGQKVMIKKYQMNMCDIRSLLNEVNLLRTLCTSDHPNLITFRECYLHGEDFWVVTDFVEGLMLNTFFEENRKKNSPSLSFPEAHIAYITSQLLQGLNFLHSKFVVHRDFRSDNILLSLNGEIKILDFGRSVQLTRKRPRCHSLVGSPSWLAPEIIRGEKYDVKVDVWALGLVVVLMFDGKLPYEGFAPLKIISMIERNGISPHLQRAGVSPESLDFVRVCLQPDPTQRPTTSVLLNHPFLRRACTAKEMKVFMEEAIKRIKQQ